VPSEKYAKSWRARRVAGTDGNDLPCKAFPLRCPQFCRRRLRDYLTSAGTSLTAVMTWMRSSGVGLVMWWVSRTCSMKWPMSVRMSGPCSTCGQPEKTSSHRSSLVILITEPEQEASHVRMTHQISRLRRLVSGGEGKNCLSAAEDCPRGEEG